MLLIRYFEEKIDWLFSRNMLPGTAHLCIGQEAVAVGAIAAANKEDYVISTHRGHGHLLAKGADPKRLFCEIMGKEPGYCKGIGGTQHLYAPDIYFWGTNGITGGGLPIATGIGLALKLMKKGRVVLTFFGDGAANQGTFHESLNMASIWKVPVVYICENNCYAMSTPVGESMNIKDIAVRGGSYGIPTEIVDGMNIIEVRDVVERAVKHARIGKGPTLVEAKTYRYCGHSKSDPRKYRKKEEEEIWQQRDPLIQFKNMLMDSGISESKLNEIKNNVINTVERACNYSQEADYTEIDKISFGEYL